MQGAATVTKRNTKQDEIKQHSVLYRATWGHTIQPPVCRQQTPQCTQLPHVISIALFFLAPQRLLPQFPMSKPCYHKHSWRLAWPLPLLVYPPLYHTEPGALRALSSVENGHQPNVMTEKGEAQRAICGREDRVRRWDLPALGTVVTVSWLHGYLGASTSRAPHSLSRPALWSLDVEIKLPT
jgi:hypothetical protein